MAADLVMRPERYDVILTSNMFGDILSERGGGPFRRARARGGAQRRRAPRGSERRARLGARHRRPEHRESNGPHAFVRDAARVAGGAKELRRPPRAARALIQAIDHGLQDPAARTGDLGGRGSTSGFGAAAARALYAPSAATPADPASLMTCAQRCSSAAIRQRNSSGVLGAGRGAGGGALAHVGRGDRPHELGGKRFSTVRRAADRHDRVPGRPARRRCRLRRTWTSGSSAGLRFADAAAIIQPSALGERQRRRRGAHRRLDLPAHHVRHRGARAFVRQCA